MKETVKDLEKRIKEVNSSVIDLFEFSDLFEINGQEEHAVELRKAINKILKNIKGIANV